MEQELISKKELLELYDISYGALYRWKRKGLIPEDWFIKKSTVTGQETFFPRKLICERMDLIKAQKDDISIYLLDRNIVVLDPRQHILQLVELVVVCGEERLGCTQAVVV